MTPPTLCFTPDTIINSSHNDIYFSRAGAIAEKNHVYVQGTDSPARWAGKKLFIIAELGFGCAASFLATIAALSRSARPPAHLHFFSFESSPLSRSQLQRACSFICSQTPSISDFAATLLRLYPAHPPLNSHLTLPFSSHISLSLITYPAEIALPSLKFGANSWFLDGFSPRLNPSIWSPQLLTHVKRLSAPDCVLASYSTSSNVISILHQLGYAVSRRKGFAAKKYALQASLPSPKQ